MANPTTDYDPGRYLPKVNKKATDAEAKAAAALTALGAAQTDIIQLQNRQKHLIALVANQPQVSYKKMENGTNILIWRVSGPKEPLREICVAALPDGNVVGYCPQDTPEPAESEVAPVADNTVEVDTLSAFEEEVKGIPPAPSTD
ncbi:MAG: hypothetical protein GY835_22510 [bacterium]|nr:hypothetical protein [bacterium]